MGYLSFSAPEYWFIGHNQVRLIRGHGLLAWLRVHNCQDTQGRSQSNRAAEVLEIQPCDQPLLSRPLLTHALKQQRYLIRIPRSHVRVPDRCVEDVLAPPECAGRFGGRRSNDRHQHMPCAYARVAGALLVSRRFLKH